MQQQNRVQVIFATNEKINRIKMCCMKNTVSVNSLSSLIYIYGNSHVDIQLICETMEDADNLAKLLVEIVLELFKANLFNEYNRNYIPPSLNALCKSTKIHQFEAIRAFSSDHDPFSLQYYDMASLVSILPLSTVYNVKPVTGPKIGLFIAMLATMRQENDNNFQCKEWMKMTMLDVYTKFPHVFEHILE